MKNPILKKSKTEPFTYYSPDGRVKVCRSTVRMYGWDISELTEDGYYKIVANASTLNSARQLVGEPRQNIR